jgi:hypothetical protein
LQKYQDAFQELADSCLWALVDDSSIKNNMPRLYRAVQRIYQLSSFLTKKETLLPFDDNGGLALLILGSFDAVNHADEMLNFLDIFPGGMSSDFLAFCKTNSVRQVSLNAKRDDDKLRILLTPPSELTPTETIQDINGFLEQCGINVRLEASENGNINVNGENPIVVDPLTARQILGGEMPPYIRKLASHGMFFSMNFNLRFGYLNKRLSHINDILWLPTSLFTKTQELNNSILCGKKFFTILCGETAETFLPFLKDLLEHYRNIFPFNKDETFISMLEHRLAVDSAVSIRKNESDDESAAASIIDIAFSDSAVEQHKKQPGSVFAVDIKTREALLGKLAGNKGYDDIFLLILKEMEEIAEEIDTNFTFSPQGILSAFSQKANIKMNAFIDALKRDFSICLKKAVMRIEGSSEKTTTVQRS